MIIFLVRRELVSTNLAGEKGGEELTIGWGGDTIE
jgi:hypothetical protein